MAIVAYKDASVTTTLSTNTGGDVIVSPSTPLPVTVTTGGVAPSAPADGASSSVVMGREAAYMMAYDQGAGTWQRVRTSTLSGTDDAAGTFNFQGLMVNSFTRVSNGTGYDRWKRASKYINIPAQAITAGTAVTIVTPTSGKKFRIMGYSLSLSVAGMVILKFGGSSTEFLRTCSLLAGTGTDQPELGQGIMPGAANDVLKIDASATGAVNGWISYLEE